MRSNWLIAAQLLALLAWAPSGVEAQLGRALDSPRTAAQRAATEAGASPEPWAFDLSASASLPLGVAVEGQLTAPGGFFARAAVGHMPSPYLQAIASVLGDAGVYAPRLQPFVDDVTGEGAWMVRLAIGWTATEGFEAAAGYTLLTTAVGLRPSSVDAAVNQPIPWPSGMERLPLRITMHALHARIGWRFVVEEHVTIRLALGWTHTISAEAQLDVPPEMRERVGDPATRLETGLRDGLHQYGFAPDLALSVGYRF